MPKIVALIPARSGSKGVPHKNIRTLQGHPLLAYSIAAGLKTDLIDEVFVSTDSKDYAALATRYNALAPFLRPTEISHDNSTDKEFVLHFLEWYYSANQEYPELIIHLRPTTPLRDPFVVNNAIQQFLSAQGATALRSVHEMSETAYKSFEIEQGMLKTLFKKSSDLDSANAARQTYPKTYQANGYVDILKPDFILNSAGFHGDKVISFETPVITEIDTEDDFKYLEYQIDNNLGLLNKLFGN